MIITMHYLKILLISLFFSSKICATNNKLLLPAQKAGTNKEILEQFKEVSGHFYSRVNKNNIGFKYNINNSNTIELVVSYYKKLPTNLTKKEKNQFKYDEKLDSFIYQYKARGLYETTMLSNLKDYFFSIFKKIILKTFPSLAKPLLKSTDQSKTSKKPTERFFTKDTTSPKLIDTKKCSTLIKNKKVLFFTGAGISIAAGIHSMSSLWKALGINWEKQVPPFVKSALNQPETLVDIIRKFYKSARDSKPTEAHLALTKLSKRLKSQVITGNFDRLHERAGITPYRVFYNPIHKDMKKAAKHIDYIMCIGSSYDFNGVLGAYKKYNPKGKIIAINLEKPSYLGDDDLFLQGELQKLLPELATLIT